MRLGIVGIGGYGWGLAEFLLDLAASSDHRLVAAADAGLDQMDEKARSLQQRQVALFDDAEKMYEQLTGGLDAVYIATSIHSHTPLTTGAFRAGLHVHLEKPAAATIEEVDEMQRVRAQTSRVCLVGFQALHQRDLLDCKAHLARGAIGEIRTLTCLACWPRHEGYYNRNNWAGRLRRGDRWVLDGPANNALAHQIMNLLLLAGGEERFAEPTSVRAELYAAGPYDSHDTAAIEITTRQGPRCVLLLTHRCRQQIHPTAEIRGSEGSASWHFQQGYTIKPDAAAPITAPGAEDTRQRMVENFLHAAADADNEQLRCRLVDARKMTQIVDGAHESSGRVHRIDPRYLAGQPDKPDYLPVKDIETLLQRCARQAILPSDLPDPPGWARPGQVWDLTDYNQFGQRFTPATCPGT
jgi:predicted dehydrogenase